MVSLYHIQLSGIPDAFFLKGDCGTGCQKVRREKWIGKRLLYSVLTRFFNWDSEAVQLYTNEHGKPYLKKTDSPLFFNISHSGDFVVCAFSDTEIGVDIERINEARLAVAGRFFHPEENQELLNCPEEKRNELFFRYWSGKESFLKYMGTGLSASLASFFIEWGEMGEIYRETVRQPVFLYECPINEGYKCFVCTGQTAPPEIIRLTWKDIG